jgi:hypothetical protein
MNRLQFLTLNLTSLVLVLLFAGHFYLAARNNRLSEELMREQTAAQANVNNARQVAGVLDQIARRMAVGSETDPRLTNILAKYGLKVTLDVNGQKKNYP